MNKLHYKSAVPCAAALLVGLAGCATPPHAIATMPLDPDLASRSHIGVVRMISGWVDADETFADTFTDALHDNLRACARGPDRLDLKVRVDRVRREDRLRAVLQGGVHELATVAELVDPTTAAVVGRYPIYVVVDAGSPIEALLSDRQLMVSDAFATELCCAAFGR